MSSTAAVLPARILLSEQIEAEETRTVHVVFKTHLDLGFTDFAANIEARYFRPFIPSAIRLAKSIRLSGADDRFAWTTGSWLIYEYLEWATAPHT